MLDIIREHNDEVQDQMKKASKKLYANDAV